MRTTCLPPPDSVPMMDAPNREAVGLPPIWTGADVAPDQQANVTITPLEDDAEDK